MRIAPTHYTIHADYLKSWVIQGSLDGESWTELDRQIENLALVNGAQASWRRSNDTSSPPRFPVPRTAEFRFIRLSHTGKSLHEMVAYLGSPPNSSALFSRTSHLGFLPFSTSST
jgi:hypothetical protein